MATTINSSALDFNNIKSNLKTYLANQEEFKDYNFEASGLSNILDVLAYNTHLNALIANFALNESFLPTAQLRSSAVSLAEGIGYIPDTDTSSQAKVRLTFNSNAAGRPVNVTLPSYTKFTSTVDDIEYSFQTVETYTASDDGTGFYEFQKSDGSNQIPLFEGTLKTKTFIVGEYEDNPVYIIPDGTLDADTVTVKVFASSSSSDFTAYQNIENASTINTNSTVYILKESPNGFFELSFGDGSTLGKPPSSGNRIEVQYLSTKGEVANGASLFTPNSTFTSGSISEDLIVRTWSNSTGGQAKESIESIRANAPFRYATQNRMVTAADYSSLILRNYSTLISDIVSWGGQDALKPEFGAVYTSILYNDDVSEETKSSTQASILDLAAQLSIVSFNLRFVEPVTTFIEVDTFFQFNPKLTDVSVNTIRNNVQSSVAEYFTSNVGRFNQAFRRSGMLTEIDESSAAILSSRADIRMQQRFTPSAPTLVTVIKSLASITLTNDQVNEILGYVTERAYLDAANFMINNNLTTNTSTYIVDELTKAKNDLSQEFLFPVAIASPDDDTFIVTSNEFSLEGQTCVIKNKLSSTTLQIVTAAGGTVIKDNLGSYNPDSGLVTLEYFNPTSIARGESLIRLSVVPANQSVVDPTRNERLVFDPDRSVVTTVLTEATN